MSYSKFLHQFNKQINAISNILNVCEEHTKVAQKRIMESVPWLKKKKNVINILFQGS